MRNKLIKLQKNDIYTSVEKTKYAFSKDNKVFMKEIGDDEKEKWHPINFQWIPIERLRSELNKP